MIELFLIIGFCILFGLVGFWGSAIKDGLDCDDTAPMFLGLIGFFSMIISFAVGFVLSVEVQEKEDVVIIHSEPAPHPNYMVPDPLPHPDELGVDSYTVDPFYLPTE